MLKSIYKTNLMILGLVLVTTSIGQATEKVKHDHVIPRALHGKQAPKFLDIAKNADGGVKYISQEDAVQYCSDQGARLPSARELAQLSMTFGAKGIAEIQSGKPDNSYREIWVNNADGSLDRFYFSEEGYQRPAGELGDYTLWSSSRYSRDYYVYGFVFIGSIGGIYADFSFQNRDIAVRCVSGR